MFPDPVHKMVMDTPGVPPNPLSRHDSHGPGPNPPHESTSLARNVANLVQRDPVTA